MSDRRGSKTRDGVSTGCAFSASYTYNFEDKGGNWVVSLDD